MRILGVDPSTHTGVACTDLEDLAIGRLIEFPNERGWSRVQLIARSFDQAMDWYRPEYVVFEDYALGMGRSATTIITQVEVGTMLRNVVYNKGISWLEVKPSTLKKWTTGKGNAKKEAMMAAAVERWQFQSDSDDIVDAFALSMYGHELVKQLDNLPQGVRKNGSW